MSEKLFGKYHDLFHLFIGFLFTGLLGTAVGWQVWKLQHAIEKREEKQLLAEQRRETDRLEREAREREQRQHFEEARQDSLSKHFQLALRDQDRAHEVAQAEMARAFTAREAAIARAADSVQLVRGREEHRREVETSQATTAFDQISRMMDRRLYRLERVLWARQLKLPDSTLNRRNEDYVQTVHEWNESLNRNLAVAELSFGSTMRTELEHGIASDFTCVHNQLRGVDPDTIALRGEIEELRRRVYDFNVAMLGRISLSGNVAAVPPYEPPPRICRVQAR